ncbi:hypothetical protein INT46_001018 [Mucor plumbeus]|uniref:Phospholipid-transporting ATPase n=1 Tax=Mucor plumbeus TaxID=97098 RepID=A0A8H7RBU5_9FUNG|nr:hypothetical protein INT46_001018 [Mucor plumbeus]
MSFTQKTAIITGATRGIGLNIAQAFAKQGARTILIGRDSGRVKHIEEIFRSTYTEQEHQGIVLDVSNKEAIDQLFKQTLKGQQIDYLINAAGISKDNLLIQLKDQDLQDIINTNLLGTMRMSQHVTKSMIRKRKGGCIINISSVVGIHGNVGQSAYSASKAGIIGFTKSLAKEVGPAKIRVNAIAPGFIDTDMTSGIVDKEKIMKLIPLGKFGNVQDVSLAALFIAQSEYIHGQVLSIDGESFNLNNPFGDNLIEDSPWIDQPTSPVGHSPYNPFADNNNNNNNMQQQQNTDIHHYSPSNLITSSTDLIDLQQSNDNSSSSRPMSSTPQPFPNYTNLTDPSLINIPHFANERKGKQKDIFEDPKIEEEDIYNAPPPPPPPTTLAATSLSSNDRTMILAADGPGESTSPYARANMQLPKKKKDRRPIRQVIKDVIGSITGRTPTVSGIPGENGARIIHINNSELNSEQKFLHNRVTTGKYSMLSFLPRFLYEEFSKYANLFFLFVSCIQQIPDISPTSRWTTLVPLVIVLFITAVKEIVEDWGVHRSDAELNSKKCKVLKGTQFVEKKWKDIKVGDVLRVESGENFPADIVLVSSSEPEGLCYIETSNLDGEVNLKIKQALPQTASILNPTDMSRLQGVIKSEQPNNRLYNYDGAISLTTYGSNNRDIPLDPTQILLRGAQLRNTQWIYGIVVFTGHETKLMLNSSKKPTKVSNVTRITNRNIMYLFWILVGMSIAGAIGGVLFTMYKGEQADYLPIHTWSRGQEFGYDILTFLILFNSFIPISLMVTMEVVKFILSYLIESDLDVYYDKTDTPAAARSSSLIEELGQVKFIFSDKTGTLTCNEMQFRQVSIGGLFYADQVDPDKAAREGSDDPTMQYNFNQLQDHLNTHTTANVINEFLTLLAVCHTVIPEKQENSDEIIYQASSPDEGALVSGAATLGYKFHTRRPNSITCTIRGQEQEFQVLNICEFNSTRKRMSAIVRGPDNRIKLYCKGADTVILERLAPDNPFVEPTLIQLEECASEGLRTLCIAMREISEEEYARWAQIQEAAATTLVNRADELDKAAEIIEKNMFLLGATAIEDRLQDGVPDTIHTLQEAGIKVWVLTGDRQETAINIGYSCKLLNEDMSLIICNEDNHWETKSFLERKLRDINEVITRGEDMEPLALIIDGKALTFALEKDIEKVFFDLSVLCKAVVCCRVSPLQKALVVKCVKKFDNSILLAIGDGANDVSMIQAAHVGVGISGVEGLQAARSADFAISQFRFLKKLLLVHGAWAYQRMSKMIFYYFYKNIALYLTQFWYAFYNGFSGSTLYESWTMSCFNVIFTFLPPLVIGIFDQIVSSRMLDKYPQMYILGQKNVFFNQKKFWGWIANATYHSIVLFFLGVGAFRTEGVFKNGLLSGQWWAGAAVFTGVLGCILWKGVLIIDYWTIYTVISMIASMAVWFLYLIIVAYIGPAISVNVLPEYFGMVPMLWGNVNFWLFLLIVPFICNLRDFVWKYGQRVFWPMPYHHVQEIQYYNLPDYRPRMDRFRQAVNKVRRIQRLKRNRGYAFSQNETDQTKIIRAYDTTIQKPSG